MTPRQQEEIVYKLIDHVYSDTYGLILEELFENNIVTETNNECSRYILEIQTKLFRSLNNLMINKNKLYKQHDIL